MADISPEVTELTNLEELYGRDADDDHVRNHHEHDTRYIAANRRRRYPPDDGAIPGSRARYKNVQEFIDQYVALVDRIEEPEGSYLGLRIEEAKATFDQRSPPTSSLSLGYYEYESTGAWIDGWRIEVSDVAPAFGRAGGGKQMLIRHRNNREVLVAQALARGVLR